MAAAWVEEAMLEAWAVVKVAVGTVASMAAAALPEATERRGEWMVVVVFPAGTAAAMAVAVMASAVTAAASRAAMETMSM